MLDAARTQYAACKQQAYAHNVAILRRYGANSYKLTQLATMRNAGVEVPYTPKNTVNSEKLANNLCRARARILEIGLCNLWDYFVTFTLRAEEHDRYDLERYIKTLSQWLRDLRKRYGQAVRYLLIPERHKDGAWHMHGLLAQLPPGALVPFDPAQRLPEYIRRKLQQGEPIYNWPAYAAKFGYVTVEPLRSQTRAVAYITKYITKDLQRSVTRMGAHLYYASHGLQRAQLVKKGTLVHETAVDYQNEHCAITWYDAREMDVDELKSWIQE